MSAARVASPGAARPAGRPTFLATVLVRHACERGPNGPTLARQLRCPVPVLPRLLLCLPPRPEQCARDVAKIATYAGVDAAQLASLLKAAGSASPAPDTRAPGAEPVRIGP